MIRIEEHGGIFGGSGFQFRGEYCEVTLKNDVKYGDLVRVGTEFQPIPIPEGVYGDISHTYFSPGGKYALIRSGTERRAGLYERVYVGDNIEYRKLPNPIGFSTQIWDLNTVIFNHRENLFIIFNDGREYGTFQIVNGVWTKIEMSFEGKSRISDGVFSPDDEYLVLRTGTTSSSINGTTVLRVTGLNSRATFGVHYPHASNDIFDSTYRPYFLTNRILTSFRSNKQTIGTITASTMTLRTGLNLVQSATHYAFLEGGDYLFTSVGNSGNALYRRNTSNVYTEIPGAFESISPSDLGGSSYGLLFPSENPDQNIVYGNHSNAIKFRFDKTNEKIVRVTGFNPSNRDEIRFTQYARTMPHNSVDRVFLLEEGRSNVGRLMVERVIGYKFDQDDQYNQDFIGIAKKSGNAGDKINVVKITN